MTLLLRTESPHSVTALVRWRKCYANLPASSLSGCDVSQRVAKEVVSISIYGELNKAQRQEVIAAMAEWL
ncbi:MAG: hypothetical protein NTX35_10320 [Verrucomicrobia bacterium]|nr:hypothetical protein [Verrucomicrobiota bacterium]